MFVDGLVSDLNRGYRGGVPSCLFYADDGVLLAESTGGLEHLLSTVTEWSERSSVRLNISKCGHLSGNVQGTMGLLAGGEALPRV